MNKAKTTSEHLLQKLLRAVHLQMVLVLCTEHFPTQRIPLVFLGKNKKEKIAVQFVVPVRSSGGAGFLFPISHFPFPILLLQWNTQFK